MRKEIHPKYGPSTASCACGATWDIKSVLPDIKLGICAKCHPFFTGKHKFIDTAGRVDKFRKRYGIKAAPEAEA